MAKRNWAAFILTLLVIIGLFSLAGAVTWLALRTQSPLQILLVKLLRSLQRNWAIASIT